MYIVDALNLLFRAYYAIQPMTNRQGQSTHALYGFIRSITKLIRAHGPEHFVAVFDGQDSKRARSALYAEYKSHREKAPGDLYLQLQEALVFCQLAGIPHLAIEGVEADDTIGSITQWAEKQGAHVVICTSDKDLCQLVSPQVKVLNVHKNDLWIDEEKVKELFGVTPKQIVDLLALMGDSSDNIPGLEGIGPKTAVSLLQEFGSLEEILAHPEKLTGKKQEVVRQGKEVALLSQKLATLDTSVPFPHEADFFKLKPVDTEGLTAFYQKMDFLSLLKELAPAAAPSPPAHHHLLTTREEVERLIPRLEKEQEVYFAISTEFTLCIDDKEVWHIPLAHADLLCSPTISWVGHDTKETLHLLPGLSPSFDTAIAAYLLAPQEGKGKQIPPSDVLLVRKLKHEQLPQLQEQGLWKVFTEIEMPLIPVLFHMERAGIYVDLMVLREMSTSLSERLHLLQQKIYALAGEEFNLNSPKQLGVILFEKLQIHPPKKTTTGFSTAADVLELLRPEHPIIDLILVYRTLEKLRSTYVDSLPQAIHSQTHRIHCNFNQTVTATGRLSCQNPNLQNIPIRSVEGKKIREAFRPERPGDRFLSADYSQIELRLLAHFSEDPLLMQAFQAGEDVHAFTAALVFDVPLSEVTSEMRSRAKAVNFGILYGQQAFGLSQGLGLGYEEASTFIETYFKRYPRVKEYLEYSKESARQQGYAETLLGRKRPLPELHNKNPMIRLAAERIAMNAPLQGTAADLIKLAMIQIDHHLSLHPHLGKMLLQVHDELVFEVPEVQVAALSPYVQRTMEHVLTLKVPLVVDISIGKNWGEC